MDMISYLYDDLLLKIMSDLPTKDVVSTMLLSKRWKFLSKMVTKLDFDDSCKVYFGTDSVPYREFQEYVDRSLVSHNSPVLEALKFKLGGLSTTAHITTWIRFAIARRVRELEINRSSEGYDYSFRLPECLYTCEKLVVLKLSNVIALDVPIEVRLLSLKALHILNVQYKKNDLRRLLSGCYVLEELVLGKSDNYIVAPSMYVIVSSLERLFIFHKYHQEDFNEETYLVEEKVVLNVLSLKYLNYVNIYDNGHLCSSENMPELVEANVKLVCKGPQKLMRSITSVKRLSLCLQGSMLEHRIEFNQLVHLELCGCGSKWRGSTYLDAPKFS